MHFLAPQPPRDLRYSENEDGSIAVDWQVDDSTGIAELFNVHVTLNELSSDICDDDSSTERSKTLQTKEKFYELQNLKPFSRYSIRITAKNEFGFSEFSEALEFDTNPSKPSPIREFSIVFESTGNDSQVDGILIWKAPCNLNGIFSSYAINVTGKKGKFEEVLSDELTESENITLSGLDRGTELSITIQANNEGVDGEPVNFLFFTPSGREFLPPAVWRCLTILSKFQLPLNRIYKTGQHWDKMTKPMTAIKLMFSSSGEFSSPKPAKSPALRSSSRLTT